MIITNNYGGKESRFFITDVNDEVQKYLSNNLFYEYPELEFIRMNADSNWTIIDVGANIGNHSIFFEKFLNPKIIYAIEPNPVACKLLLANLALNYTTKCNTDFIMLGLSDVDGNCDVVNDHNLCLAKLVPGNTIKVVTGDSLFDHIHVDFIKIDVEGMEMNVIKGLQSVININHPMIYIEVSSNNNDEFIKWIDYNNYSVVREFKRFNSINFLIKHDGYVKDLKYAFISDLIDKYMLIPGWLEKDEALLLYMLARGRFNDGAVVELGAYQGRSTACLARGLVDSGSSSKVISIDTHAGCHEHQPGAPNFNSHTVDTLGKVNTLPLIKRNLKSIGLEQYVDIWCMSTCDASGKFVGDIGVLFIDADHSVDAVRNDFKLWSKYLRYGSIIALHDVGTWDGPTIVSNELISSGLYQKFCQTSSILVLTKVA